MDCKNARLLLEFLRPAGTEMDAADAEALRQHLAECPDCAVQAREERRADEHLGRAVRDVPVPAGLRERLHQRLAAERRAWGRRWLLRGGAAAAVLLLAGWLGYAWLAGQRSAVSAETVRQLADFQAPATHIQLAAKFAELGVPVPLPAEYDYSLVRSYGLAPLQGQAVPHLMLVSEPPKSAPAVAHLYILSEQQFDLQETMANIGSLSSGNRYAIAVSFSPDRDAIFLVLYTVGADLNRFTRPLHRG